MKYFSRKYIDLILKAEGKWANWDPPIPSPDVGDYGTIDNDTGVLEKEGNIYDQFFEQYFPAGKLKDMYPPVLAPADKEIQIKSDSAHSEEFSMGPEVNALNLVEASAKGKWKFSSKRGAVLIMVQPRITFLPRNILLKQLVAIPELKDKYLVTDVTRCPAYALYLSSEDDDEVSLALDAKAPIPQVPGLSAGGEIGGAWYSKAGNGTLKKGGHPAGTYDYTPLFALKKIRTGWFRSDSAPHPEDDDLWVSAEAPWDSLDDQGEEQKIVADDDIPDW